MEIALKPGDETLTPQIRVDLDIILPISQILIKEEADQEITIQVTFLELWDVASNPNIPDFLRGQAGTAVEEIIEGMSEKDKSYIEELLLMTGGDTRVAIGYILGQQNYLKTSLTEHTQIEQEEPVENGFTAITKQLGRELTQKEVLAINTISNAGDAGVGVRELKRILGLAPRAIVRELRTRGIIKSTGRGWNTIYTIAYTETTNTAKESDEKPIVTAKINDWDTKLLLYLNNTGEISSSDIKNLRQNWGFRFTQSGGYYVKKLVELGALTIEYKGRSVIYHLSTAGKRLAESLVIKSEDDKPKEKSLGLKAETMPRFPNRFFWIYLYPNLKALIQSIPNTLKVLDLNKNSRLIPKSIEELKEEIEFNGNILDPNQCRDILNWILNDKEYRKTAIELQVEARVDNNQKGALALISIFEVLLEDETTLSYLQRVFNASNKEELSKALKYLGAEDEKLSQQGHKKKTDRGKSKIKKKSNGNSPAKETITHEDTMRMIKEFEDDLKSGNFIARELLEKEVTKLITSYLQNKKDTNNLGFVIAGILRATLKHSMAGLRFDGNYWVIPINKNHEEAVGSFIGNNKNTNPNTRGKLSSGTGLAKIDDIYMTAWFKLLISKRGIGTTTKVLKPLIKKAANIFQKFVEETTTDSY